MPDIGLRLVDVKIVYTSVRTVQDHILNHKVGRCEYLQDGYSPPVIFAVLHLCCVVKP